MCGIFADSKVRYTREGREMGREEAKIEMIADLISKESWTFEKAVSFARIPEDRVEYVRFEVNKILNNTLS